MWESRFSDCLVWQLFLELCLRFCVINAEHVVELDGAWLTSQSGSKASAVYAARVPGNIYTDLWRNGTLSQDPYYRFNDVEYRWVSQQDWTFWRAFKDASLKNFTRVLLKCDGVDTVSAIYINNKLIGSTDNQFIQYYFDVKDAITENDNEITFRFKSPTIYANDKFESYIWERGYMVPPACPVAEFHGECHANFIRKAQSSFAWDWGPAFPTVGIWRNISIIAFNSALIEAVTVNTSWTPATDRWQLTVGVFLLTTINAGNGVVQITIPQLGFTVEEPVTVLPDRVDYTFNYKLDNADIEKWWPYGYGDQKLYDMKVVYTSSGGEEQSMKELKIGFRQVELVQDHLPKPNTTGLTFYFRVNGVNIWSKGSNWIPAHALQDAITPDYLRWLLQSSTAANMNMLRVWGGGYYESDEFYQICDELGIMIWQDFMFACAMYPTNDDFLSSVRHEVRDNILRLQHHPSIVIWAGNNENEVALVQNWYGTSGSKYATFKADYIQLYIATIRDESMKVEIPNARPWVSSSPSDGKLTEEEGWISDDPYSNFYGDVHFYSYLVDPWDWTIYPPTRFSSEYGFQSWESIETLTPYSEPDDLTYLSKFAFHRQHHPFGQIEMLYEVAKNFKIPPPISDPARFPAIVYLTQINQAMGIKTETEFYRRIQNIINADSSGFTKGALYWQLNSIWPCPSWASMEFGGKWKMLHYYAREFFQPVLLSPYVDKKTGTLHVSLINDHLVPINNQMHIGVFDYTKGFDAQSNVNMMVNQTPQNASVIYEEKVADLLNRSGCRAAANCLVVVSLDDGNVTNVLFLGSPKDATIPKSVITVTDVTAVDNRNFNVKLHSTNIAPFVWLEATGILGYFSKNGHVQYVEQDTVQFMAHSDITVDQLRSGLKVMSLMDIY